LREVLVDDDAAVGETVAGDDGDAPDADAEMLDEERLRGLRRLGLRRGRGRRALEAVGDVLRVVVGKEVLLADDRHAVDVEFRLVDDLPAASANVSGSTSRTSRFTRRNSRSCQREGLVMTRPANSTRPAKRLVWLSSTVRWAPD
jgi:hypothetical protein